MLPPQVRYQILSGNEGQNQYVLWRGMASKGHLDLEPELPRKTNLIEIKHQGNKVRVSQLKFYSKTRKIDMTIKRESWRLEGYHERREKNRAERNKERGMISYWYQILICTKIIRMWIDITSLFSNTHSSHAFLVLQSVNNLINTCKYNRPLLRID